MSLIASDILGDLCGLSLGLLSAIPPVGMALWLFGWWSHRFWIVLATTVLAGVFGLLEATSWRAQPIVVAVLLAIAAGILALALVRVVTFTVGGMGTIYLAHLVFPAWNQPVICFLVGGLVCLLLFRWFFMALTSFLGSIVVLYGGLALMHYHEVLDALTWVEHNRTFLTLICAAMTLVGFIVQFMLERRRARREHDEEEPDGFTSMILGRIGFGSRAERDAA